MTTSVQIHPEIKEALHVGKPVVALETAVVTHGLPRTPLQLPPELIVNGWNATHPTNLELARAMARCVRREAAIPALVAILNGTLTIGLDDDQLVQLASDPHAQKASTSSIASIMAGGGNAGTTVSATLTACALTHGSSLSGLRFFATGGIGGIHRNWQRLPDVSADLRALANTPVCVVCSGAKSILDLPATLEALESLSVPIVGFQTGCFPQFQCHGDESLKLAQRVDDVQTAARLCRIHWSTLNAQSALLLANQPPRQFAVNPADLERAITAAEALAAAREVTGAARTPFLLDEVARQTKGKSLLVNVALLIENATLAARVANSHHRL